MLIGREDMETPNVRKGSVLVATNGGSNTYLLIVKGLYDGNEVYNAVDLGLSELIYDDCGYKTLDGVVRRIKEEYSSVELIQSKNAKLKLIGTGTKI